jgi:hypothetical protein
MAVDAVPAAAAAATAAAGGGAGRKRMAYVGSSALAVRRDGVDVVNPLKHGLSTRAPIRTRGRAGADRTAWGQAQLTTGTWPRPCGTMPLAWSCVSPPKRYGPHALTHTHTHTHTHTGHRARCVYMQH